MKTPTEDSPTLKGIAAPDEAFLSNNDQSLKNTPHSSFLAPVVTVLTPEACPGTLLPRSRGNSLTPRRSCRRLSPIDAAPQVLLSTERGNVARSILCGLNNRFKIGSDCTGPALAKRKARIVGSADRTSYLHASTHQRVSKDKMKGKLQRDSMIFHQRWKNTGKTLTYSHSSSVAWVRNEGSHAKSVLGKRQTFRP